MKPIEEVIIKKKTNINTIWLMRQAGRYLPEFRKIRKKNPDFINLCLNEKLVPQITLQPLRRFDLDAAIIFSDILMIPFALGQEVTFKKNYGPILGNLNMSDMEQVNKGDFKKRLRPVYNSMNILSKKLKGKNKSLIGFTGAPWTTMVYMLNRKSPKKNLSTDLISNKPLVKKTLKKIIFFTKQHIKNQVDSGATLIQIFDSWAGLVKSKDLYNLIYNPTLEIVKYVNSLNVPIICFPRNIKNYKEYAKIIKPDAINIDYSVNIKKICNQIEIPIQGGLDPKILLSDRSRLKKETIKILTTFKDHPYIFNLGHGVLPKTKPSMVDYLVKLVKDY